MPPSLVPCCPPTSTELHLMSLCRTTISILLAAGLALIAGMGEGLHLLPGCGHAVECSESGWLFLLDGECQADPLPSRGPGFRERTSSGNRILDEADCLICRVLGKCPFGFCPMELEIGTPLPSIPFCFARPVVCAPPRASFSARAPPQT